MTWQVSLSLSLSEDLQQVYFLHERIREDRERNSVTTPPELCKINFVLKEMKKVFLAQNLNFIILSKFRVNKISQSLSCEHYYSSRYTK